MRRTLLSLFSILNIAKGETSIKNIHIPACKNCIYYKPDPNYSTLYNSHYKCKMFGEKDLVTGEITYYQSNYCREKESMCGIEGKYFKEEKNNGVKMFKYHFTRHKPIIYTFSVLIAIFGLSIFTSFYKN